MMIHFGYERVGVVEALRVECQTWVVFDHSTFEVKSNIDD